MVAAVVIGIVVAYREKKINDVIETFALAVMS